MPAFDLYGPAYEHVHTPEKAWRMTWFASFWPRCSLALSRRNFDGHLRVTLGLWWGWLAATMGRAA